MSRRSISVLLVAMLVIVFSMVAPHAVADTDWVTRPIVRNADNGIVYNADVMVSPAGHVAVGYALFDKQEPDGPITLARLNDRLFDYKDFNLQDVAPSFAMDRSGGVYYAGGYYSSTIFGYDLGMWGSMKDGVIIESDPRPVCPSVALDQHGIPTIAGSSGSGNEMLYSRFDIPSGQWKTESVGPGGFLCANGHSLCFDTANKATVAYVQGTGNSDEPAPLIIAREGLAGWSNITVADDAIFINRVSIAAAPNGGVGFAYVSPEGLMFGTNDGPYTSVELIAPDITGRLASHSLAYDPDGNPAIVFGHDDSSGLISLLRRDTEGTWSGEFLPALEEPISDTVFANLAFDADGNPYVLVADCIDGGLSYITLFSPVLSKLIPGDADGDDDVDFADYQILEAHYGEKMRGGPDFDYDGDVDFADYQILEAHYGEHLPEPGTLTLMLLGIGGILTMKKKKRVLTILLAAVITCGLAASAQAAMVTLSITADDGTWRAYASVGDGCEGLASFIIDVKGTGDLTVTGSVNESPKSDSELADLFGFYKYRNDGDLGIGITVGQDTLYDAPGNNDPVKDAKVLQLVGIEAGSKDDVLSGNTITWEAPVLVASGTYSGVEGWMSVDLGDGQINLLSTVGSWSGPGNVEEAGNVVGGSVFVPEPGTICLLAFGGLALIRHRRCRR